MHKSETDELSLFITITLFLDYSSGLFGDISLKISDIQKKMKRHVIILKSPEKNQFYLKLIIWYF